MVAGNAERYHDVFGRIMTESSDDVMMLVRRADFILLHVTDNASEFFGVEPVIGECPDRLFECAVEEDRPELSNTVASWRESKTDSAELQVRFEDPGNAASRECSFNLKTVSDGLMGLIVLHELARTLSHIDQLQKELEEKEQIALARIEALSRMSHEIRTPLSGIIGLLRLAESHLDSIDELRIDIKKAVDLGMFLLGMINDVLDMGRIESGKTELEEKPFDIAKTADDLRSLFERQAVDKGIDYSVRMKGCTDPFVAGDRMRLTQVVINFVSNAFKFTPRDGSVDVVFAESGHTDTTVDYEISVTDTGCGMSKETLETIFQPYVQGASSVSRQYGGTGLGMSIADGIAQMMGGTISVESELGKGSTFTFAVTLSRASAASAHAEEAAERAYSVHMTGSEGHSHAQINAKAEAASSFYGSASAETKPTLSGLHFLIAEDNDVNAQITDALLKMRGASCARAMNGNEAVTLFSDCEPGTFDAILMDIHMPVCDGYTATGIIRALDHPEARSIPIIALSAGTVAEEGEESLRSGMDAYLGKPIDFEELANVLLQTKAKHN